MAEIVVPQPPKSYVYPTPVIRLFHSSIDPRGVRGLCGWEVAKALLIELLLELRRLGAGLERERLQLSEVPARNTTRG